MGRAVEKHLCKHVFIYSRVNTQEWECWVTFDISLCKIYGKYVFYFVRNCQLSSRVVVSFCIPTTMYESCFCSTFMQALDIIEILKI